MDLSLLDLALTLLEKMCVVVVAAYLITHSPYFKRIIEGGSDYKDRLVLMVAFGLVSIYGTLSGIPVQWAVANIRDLGPMVAGLACGPLVGLGAGLIGGIHRLLVGGFTADACAISTVLAGLLGGMIYLLNKKRFVGLYGAVLFAALMESLHIGLVLAISTPFRDALDLSGKIWLPMVLANAAGAAIFAFIILGIMREKETTRQRDEYRGELERKRTELNIARDIQMSFLPDSIPVLEGYDIGAMSLPANEVGGDFYDFIAMPDGRLGLTIADVSGKSVPAALFMALSRAVVRSNAMWGGSPAGAIKKSNELITYDSRSGMFVTLFYGVLDPKNRSMAYVNAGHNPPAMLRNGRIDALAARGIALGAMEGADYDEAAIGLLPGDVVVFYTDGVTEASDVNGEMFGEERLYGSIRASYGLHAGEMVDRIKSDVLAFCGGAQQSDDMTLVVLKVV